MKPICKFSWGGDRYFCTFAAETQGCMAEWTFQGPTSPAKTTLTQTLRMRFSFIANSHRLLVLHFKFTCLISFVYKISLVTVTDDFHWLHKPVWYLNWTIFLARSFKSPQGVLVEAYEQTEQFWGVTESSPHTANTPRFASINDNFKFSSLSALWLVVPSVTVLMFNVLLIAL